VRYINFAFSTNIWLYVGNYTRWGHSYYGTVIGNYTRFIDFDDIE